MGIWNHLSILVSNVAWAIQMKQHKPIFISLISLFILAAVAVAQTNNKNTASGGKPEANRGTQAASASTGNDGEKRFQTNCGRCHNPPENLSPREARAVVRHMRVRAMLTAEDEKLIMEFIAP